MLSLTEIRNRLRDRNLSAVARGAKVSRPTLQDLKDNEHVNPEYKTIEKLSKYFEDQEQ